MAECVANVYIINMNTISETGKKVKSILEYRAVIEKSSVGFLRLIFDVQARKIQILNSSSAGLKKIITESFDVVSSLSFIMQEEAPHMRQETITDTC